MLSAILLSSVLIHLELIPSGKFIMSEQKNQASRRPTLDFLHASFFGHVSCLCRSIFYNPTVTNSMMLSTIVGMFTSGSQNSLNEYLNLLYRNIFFGAQAFATTIGLLHSSRLFRFTFLVALFVKVTIHSLIMSPSGMRSRGI